MTSWQCIVDIESTYFESLCEGLSPQFGLLSEPMLKTFLESDLEYMFPHYTPYPVDWGAAR